MFRYQTIKPLGDGAYGTVHTALNKATGEVVAVKKMKARYSSWEECMQLREVKALRKLCHPNVVRLREVVRDSDELYLIFELLDFNLLSLLKDKRGTLKESRIRSIMSQIIHGVAYVHLCGFFHRDIKPENILLRGDTVKLCDFGLAREVHSRPPYTEYVSTRWYRAPEILLRSTNYGSPVDVWAMGTLMAELVTGRPLFPGTSEVDTLAKITTVLGTPGPDVWREGRALAARAKFRFPSARGIPLARLLPQASPSMLQVIKAMLAFDPTNRPEAQALLRFPFFMEGIAIGKMLPDIPEWPETPPKQKQLQLQPVVQGSPQAWDSLTLQMERSGGSDSPALESELSALQLERCEPLPPEVIGARLDTILDRERKAMRAAHLRQISTQETGGPAQNSWRRSRRRKREERSPRTPESPDGVAGHFPEEGEGTPSLVVDVDDSEFDPDYGGGPGFVGAYRPSFGRADSEPNLLHLRPVGEFGLRDHYEDMANDGRAQPPASPSVALAAAAGRSGAAAKASTSLKAPAPKRAASAATIGVGMDVDILGSATEREQSSTASSGGEQLPAFPSPLGTFGPSAPTLSLGRHRRSSSQPTTGWRLG